MNWLLGLYPGDATTWLLATIVVQLAAIVALGWGLTRLFARNAAVRYGIWLSALVCVPLGTLAACGLAHGGITLIALPWLPPVEQAPPATEPAGDGTAAADTGESTAGCGSATRTSYGIASAWSAVGSVAERLLAPDALRRLVVVGLLIWVAGIVWLLARLAWGVNVLLRFAGRLRPVRRFLLGDAPRQVCQVLGMAHFPVVMSAEGLRSPLAVWLLRPIIVLPERLLDELTPRQLRDVLTHECAHFMKRDHAVGLLQRLMQIVFWPHPAIYVLGRELARAREEVCDNYVLAGGDVPNYARTLVQLSEQAGTSPAALSAIGILHFPHPLARRVAGLFDGRRVLVTRMNRIALAATAGGFLAAAGVLSGMRLVPAERPAVPEQTSVAMAEPIEVAPLPDEPESAADQPSRSAVEVAVAPAIASSVARQPQATPSEAVAVAASVEPQKFANERPQQNSVSAAATAPRTPEEPVVKIVVKKAAPVSETPLPQPVAAGPREPQLTVDAVAYASLQPAMKIMAQGPDYLVALRFAEEIEPKLAVEPGKLRRVVLEQGPYERLLWEVLIVPGPEPEQLLVHYRVAIQLDPETASQWQAQSVVWKLGRWHALAPRVEPVSVEPWKTSEVQRWLGDTWRSVWPRPAAPPAAR